MQVFSIKSMDNNTQVRHITWIGMITNLGLSGLKFLLGFLGSSQAVIADAIHSLSDMTTDLTVLIGVKFWSAPADSDHPYGHKRIETMITVMIGFLLAWAAIEMGLHAIQAINQKKVLNPHWFAIIGPAISIVSKEWLFRWTINVGKRVKSQAVIANAWHHRTDALGSIPTLVAVGIAVFKPEWWFVDQIGALIVSMFILKVAWDIAAPAIADLTDRGASIKDREKIIKIALTVPGVMEVHALRTRRLGVGLFLDMHVLVDGEMTVRKGHDISTEVKHLLIDKGPNINDVMVHLEPYDY